MTNKQSADLLTVANKIMAGKTTVADGNHLLSIRHEMLDAAQEAVDYIEASDAARALGSMTSERKARAVRENGKKGGRPKKEKPVE